MDNNITKSLTPYAEKILNVKKIQVNLIHSHLLPYLHLHNTIVQFDVNGLFYFDLKIEIKKRFVSKEESLCDIEMDGVASNTDLMNKGYLDLATKFLLDQGFIVCHKASNAGKLYIEFDIEDNFKLMLKYIEKKVVPLENATV